MISQDQARESWSLVVHDNAEKLSAIRAALDLPLSHVGDLWNSLPGVVKRGSRTDLFPILKKLLRFGVWAEIRLPADFAEVHWDDSSPSKTIQIPLSEGDYIPLARCPLAWRWTDPRYRELPEDDLKQI